MDREQDGVVSVDRLIVESIRVGYGAKTIIDAASFTLGQGEIGCLLGASGSGKTTLLRALAGFEPVRSGRIWIEGRLMAGDGIEVSPEGRRVGMIFQDYALFPHLTIRGNIGFGLRRQGQRERDDRIDDLLALASLNDVADAYPGELSGGEQQRVALARAMAPRPDILLMDEPFSNLDRSLRMRIAEDVRAILTRGGVTALMVTHDQGEAFALADKIGVIAAGRLRQWDYAPILCRAPADDLVAMTIGADRMVLGTVVDRDHVCVQGIDIAGRVPEALAPGCAVRVLLRPEIVIADEQ